MKPLQNRSFIVFFTLSFFIHLGIFIVLGYLTPLPVLKQPGPMRIFIEKPSHVPPAESLSKSKTDQPQKKEEVRAAQENTALKKAEPPVETPQKKSGTEKLPEPLLIEKKAETSLSPDPALSEETSEGKEGKTEELETIKTSEHIPVSIPQPDSDGYIEENLDDFLSRILSRIEKAKNYPLVAKRRGMQGEVVCRFVITKDGVLKDAVVISSSPHSILDRAALDAIKKAVPYPAFPEFYKEESLTSSVTIRFELN